MKPIQRLTLTSLFLFSLVVSVTAQDYMVTPIENYFTEYRDKHQIIKTDVMGRTDLTLDQKLALYESEMTGLKNIFRAKRKQEYESKSTNLSVGHSCTSKSSGGKKNCGWKGVTAPISDLYTTTSWVSVKGKDKGIKVSNDGSHASIKMTVAGKGRNAGILTATFRYRPESITRLIEQELVALFIEETSSL